MSKLSSSLSNNKSKEDKTYPTEIRDIKQFPKEKIISARIGSESDTYIHFAIKKGLLELLKFLIKEVPEIDILTKNS